MKLICSNKVIDLDKFESVEYRASLWGDEYPVEAIRHETSGGFFGGIGTATVEIARFRHQSVAKALVKAITNTWISGKKTFNVTKWIANKAAQYMPSGSKQLSPSDPFSRRVDNVIKSIEQLDEQAKNEDLALNKLQSGRKGS